MAEIQLIRAGASDAELIHKMKYEAFMPLYERYHDDNDSPAKEPLQKVVDQLESENTDYYIIRFGDVSVGAVRVVREPDESGKHIYCISPMFILPEYQNMHIGQNAMKYLFKRYSDADKWRLSTIKQEKGNCHLYEKLGFERVGYEVTINELMTLVFYER